MRAFTGLFIKELKLSKNLFLLSLLAMFIIVLLAVGLQRYFHEPQIFAVITLTIFFMHVFFMPAFLFISLKTEAQTQLWMHNPNSGSKLFFAKLSSCAFYFLFSIVIALILAVWGINQAILLEALPTYSPLTQPMSNLLFSGFIIFFMSLFLGIWVLFFWTFYHALKNIPIIRNLRWPIMIGIWLLLSFVENYVTNLPIYQKMIRIGTIKIDSIPFIRFETGAHSFTAGVHDAAGLSIMNCIIYLVIIVIVFICAVWLLERKVEV